MAGRFRMRATLAVLGVAPLPSAGATPGQGVAAWTLAAGTSDGTLSVRAQGPTDVTVRVITVQPGGSTGWHYHPGPLLAVVESGTLTRTLADCSVEVSSAGDTILEPAGRRHVHIGRNHGTEPVVLYAAYLVPAGAPTAVDAADPGCGT
jgi:quercetin dioxygenase-like cupin family protein